MKKLLAQWMLFGTLCVTIPDAKDQLVVQAKDLYNARNGSSLSVVEFVKVAVRHAVMNEIAIERQQTVSATATASTQAYQAQGNANQQSVEATIAASGGGW